MHLKVELVLLAEFLALDGVGVDQVAGDQLDYPLLRGRRRHEAPVRGRAPRLLAWARVRSGDARPPG